MCQEIFLVIERMPDEYLDIDVRFSRHSSQLLFNPTDPRHQRMARALQDYKDALVSARMRWEERREGKVEVSIEEQIEKLRSLGYIQ